MSSFYKNTLKSTPNGTFTLIRVAQIRLQDSLRFLALLRHINTLYCTGDFIEKVHETWYGDYELLERHHGCSFFLTVFAAHIVLSRFYLPICCRYSMDFVRLFRWEGRMRFQF